MLKEKRTYSDDVEQAIKILRQHLKEQGHRFTIERVDILNFIYTHKGHYDANTLYNMMIDKNIQISRPSVFTTLELLTECGLVERHFFLKSVAQYERAGKPHFHQICTKCGAIREFTDEKLLKSIQKKEFGMFHPNHNALYLYGLCNNCFKTNKTNKSITQINN